VRLIVKINLVITLAFALGLILSAQLMWDRFLTGAREEVLQGARLMLATSTSVMRFVEHEVSPLPRLLGTDQVFVKAAVPFFAASQTFSELHSEYPDYSLRFVALNPTNPTDRPEPDEASLIDRLRADRDLKDVVADLKTPAGSVIKLATPIVATKDCLTCHGKPADAPPAMIRLYGDQQGFGWEEGSTIGAAIVSVPTTLAVAQAKRSYRTLVTIFGVVFVVVLLLLNILLFVMVTRPVKRMARIAEDVSLGKPDVPEYEHRGKDEIAILSRAFTRMRRSLESALKMIEG
jgi:HAMP domain-containing protein